MHPSYLSRGGSASALGGSWKQRGSGGGHILDMGGCPASRCRGGKGTQVQSGLCRGSARGLGHVPLHLSFPYQGGDDRSGGVVWHLQGARSQPHTQHYSCYYVWTRRPLRPQQGSLGLPGAPLCGPSSSPWAGPCLSLSCPFPAPAQHLAPPWAYCLRTQGHPVVLGENKGAPHPHFLTRLGLQVPDPALDRINTGAHKGHPGTGGAGWGGSELRAPRAMCLRGHQGPPAVGSRAPPPHEPLRPQELEPQGPARGAEALAGHSFLFPTPARPSQAPRPPAPTPASPHPPDSLLLGLREPALMCA